MLIGIIILICAITVVYVFRRHGNSLGLQQGKDTFSLPVIKFDEYEDKYGDELKAEIDEAYNIWYYGEDEYKKMMNVTKFRLALEKRSCIYTDLHDRDTLISFTDISEYSVLKMVDDYITGRKFNMYDVAIHDTISVCNRIVEGIKREAKRTHEIKEEQKYISRVTVHGNKYTYDKRYETSEQAVRRITKTIELSEEQEIKRKQKVLDDIKEHGIVSKDNNPVPP